MNKQKKNQAIAATIALTLLVGGTYAWQSFSQTIINETAGFDADQGSRLHNDFNGSNADVYVENFASESGSTLFTRIRLHEYMEIGEGAGEGTATIVRGDEPVSSTDPVFANKETWDIYLDQGNDREEEDIRSYLGLNYGSQMNANAGATVYMPTFNKNFDDKTADINGSLLGLGGSEYDDYTTYSIGESITDTATYSKDSLAAEGQTPNAEGVVELTETHTAQSTLHGYVTTMAEWNTNGQETGDFWVFDTDGWAYWANGLAPQTATSLLVDSISKVRTPDADYYYGLHVVNQTATADGWVEGIALMGKDDITVDAINLFKIVGGIVGDIESTLSSLVIASAGGVTSIAPGGTLQFSVESVEGLESEEVTWSLVSSATGVSINATSGLLSTTNHTIADSVEVQVQAKSKEVTSVVSDPITVNINRTKYVYGTASSSQVTSLIGTTGTLTVNGSEFYVIGSGTFSSRSAVKLLLKSSTGTNSVFNTSTSDGNAYNGSVIQGEVSKWYTTWLAAGSVGSSGVVTTGTTTRSTGEPEILTSDVAFLLSSDEASALTPTSIRTTGSIYWLRTPSSSVSNYAYVVNSSGIVSSGGNVPDSRAVRPALWIYL